MRLGEICPPSIKLKSFVKSPIKKNCLILLEQYDRVYPDSMVVYREEPAAISTYLKVFDVYDVREEIVGHVIEHRKMQNMLVGDFYVSLKRLKLPFQPAKQKVTEWSGEYISFLESEAGCVMFNLCTRDNVVSDKIDIL